MPDGQSTLMQLRPSNAAPNNTDPYHFYLSKGSPTTFWFPIVSLPGAVRDAETSISDRAACPSIVTKPSRREST
jgi:hypothetical protein